MLVGLLWAATLTAGLEAAVPELQECARAVRSRGLRGGPRTVPSSAPGRTQGRRHPHRARPGRSGARAIRRGALDGFREALTRRPPKHRRPLLHGHHRGSAGPGGVPAPPGQSTRLGPCPPDDGARPTRPRTGPRRRRPSTRRRSSKNPGSLEVLVALGDLTRLKSRFDEALTYYSRAVAVRPAALRRPLRDGRLPFLPGAAGQGGRGLPPGAARGSEVGPGPPGPGDLPLADRPDARTRSPSFEAATALEPRMRQAYYQLGRAYRVLGRSAEAEAASAKVQELVRAGACAEASIERPDPH